MVQGTCVFTNILGATMGASSITLNEMMLLNTGGWGMAKHMSTD